MSDVVKAVFFVERAVELNQDELREALNKAIKDGNINHFEIETRPKDE